MKNVIEVIENHTNNEVSEGAAEAGLVTLIAAGLIYCIALLV